MKSFVSKILETLKQRRTDYAHPAVNHQLTADMLSAWLSNRTGQPIELSAEDICVINVIQKLSRVAHVTKNDSWLDVVGYAENVAMLDDCQRNHTVAPDPDGSTLYPEDATPGTCRED